MIEMEENSRLTHNVAKEKSSKNCNRGMGIILFTLLIIVGFGVGILIKQNSDVSEKLSDINDKFNSLSQQINETKSGDYMKYYNIDNVKT
ncbi:MAG: hypothetical protein LBM09_00270 [Candidatus Nomurabacteria bacterium]|jgi:hypothetical protein|nr:hypothetical protein [Candidatus Nomurabacteria bacterium]